MTGKKKKVEWINIWHCSKQEMLLFLSIYFQCLLSQIPYCLRGGCTFYQMSTKIIVGQKKGSSSASVNDYICFLFRSL